MFSHVAASQICVPAADSGKLAELRALLTPVKEVRGSWTQLGVILFGRGFPYCDNAVEIREWKRPQQHGIDRIENGCIGADTQRESNHRHRGETGTVPQHAQPVTDILDQSSHCLFLIRTAALLWDPLSWHGALEYNKRPTPPE